jgi:hypothetical protein
MDRGNVKKEQRSQRMKYIIWDVHVPAMLDPLGPLYQKINYLKNTLIKRFEEEK